MPLDLHLLREIAGDRATIGHLFISGAWKWFSLEDRLHTGPKVQGETCIPAGKYQIVITPSVRFARPLPLLLSVPGFTGIRIHPGNTDEDTSGCILVGGGYQPKFSVLLHSRVACDAVQEQIQRALDAKQSVWITIEDPVTSIPPAPGTKVLFT